MLKWFDAFTSYAGAVMLLPDNANKEINGAEEQEKDDESSFDSSLSEVSDCDRKMSSQFDEDDYYADEFGTDADANNSDEELWDILENSRQSGRPTLTREERRVYEKRALARLQREEEERKQKELKQRKMEEEQALKAQEEQKINDLFSFFSKTSEKQPMTEEKPHVIPQATIPTNNNDSQQKSVNTPFGDVNVLERNKKKITKADIEKLKHQLRKQKFIKTFSEEMESNNNARSSLDASEEETNEENEFRDLVEEDDEADVHSSNSTSSTTRMRRSFFDKYAAKRNATKSFISLFARNYNDNKFVTRFLIVFCGFIFLVLGSLILFFRNDLAYSQRLFNAADAVSLTEVDLSLWSIRFLFSQMISIVTMMEISLSESGAFIYRAIYENTVFRQTSVSSPILESRAYVGKVVQLGSYMSILFGLVATILGCFSVCKYMDYISTNVFCIF
jgi:hypothetical protein